jgi:HEAT repeat protein
MKLLDVVLKELADPDVEISVAGLHALSGLERAQLAQVQAAWLSIPAERRAIAMRHLVEIDEDSFENDFSAMYRLGLTDPDPQVCANAISGLWEDASPDLIPALLQHVASGQPDIVRAAAASTLGHYLFDSELETVPAAKVRPIITALKVIYRDVTEPIEVRRRALESLSFLTDDEVSQLIAQAYQHADEKMRLSAVFSMGRSLDAERWGQTVLEELSAAQPEMRFEAARAAGELEYAPAAKHLAPLLDDVDEEVQSIAVWALGEIGGDKARSLLLAVLDSDAEHLHEDAEDALAELEFKSDNLDFTMFDFEDEDEEEWVLDDNAADEDDEVDAA